jgi:DNA modification methylase
MKFKKEQLADNVVLYCGDCREVLPTLDKIDAVVSDPPYGIEELVVSYGRFDGDKKITNDKNLLVVGEAFSLIRKKLRPNAWIAAFYSCRVSPKFFKMMEAAGYHDANYFGEMVWDKKNVGLGTQIRYRHENVAFYKIGKPEPLNSAASILDYMILVKDAKISGTSGGHPHEKPHQVMVNLVGMLPAKCTVLDPFMGTGSTGAAAIEQKHGFIGIEYLPKYFDFACKKISAAIKQPVAFWE